ncbi:MAG: S-layer homology domain-containing protein, partial [Dialister sp.]|nr:S-layer homology domain-containing protein [Dialister sp.]
MKKILALAAVAALTAGVSAYAANPFSDVTADDWAYQAVSDLSAQGVVEGYPDGTFKGERNMTRYELAQIVARLMAKEDQLNAEQQATLDKLAGEYADELANLGVRVSNLEKKVGNLYWSGDARMRYQDKGNNKDAWNGRIRLNVKGQVNESTYVQGRFLNEMNFKDHEDSTTSMD